MDTARKTDRIIILALVALAVGITVWIAAGSSKPRITATTVEHEVTYTDYNGKKIGILTGTNMEAESFKYFPNSEYLYFNGYPDLNTALENGVIDAYLGDELSRSIVKGSVLDASYRLTDMNEVTVVI